jgi:Ca2+-binding RTX toxin-like protein
VTAGTLTILADAGNDSINTGDVGTATANVTAGTGDDTITTGVGNDTVTGGVGNDVITDGGGKNVFALGAAHGTLTINGTGVDTITSSVGGQTIVAHGTDTGATSADVVTLSGAGADHVTLGLLGTGANTVTTGTGSDVIATGGGADNINSGDGNDKIDAGAGNDVINGGAGNDAIHGGHGVDLMTGGGGNDLFTFNVGDSPVSAGASTAGAGLGPTGVDQIRDWTSADGLEFFNAATGTTPLAHGTDLNFSTTTASDFASAITAANAHLGGGIYVAVQVGSDVVVFADNSSTTVGTPDHSITAADDAVTLVGKSLADITFSNFIGA